MYPKIHLEEYIQPTVQIKTRTPKSIMLKINTQFYRREDKNAQNLCNESQWKFKRAST